MPAGLTVQGDAGTFQIDETYSNHHLTAKATVTTDTSFGTVGASFVVVTLYDCHNTVLALRSNNPVAFHIASRSGTTWTYHIYTGPAPSGSTIGTSITYYRFDSTPPASVDNFGLECYTYDGQLIFDSGYRPLNVVDFKLAEGGDNTYTYTSGHTYAGVQCRNGSRLHTEFNGATSSWIGAYYFIGAMTATNGIRFRETGYDVVDSGSSPPVTPAYTAYADWLVIDVTGY